MITISHPRVYKASNESAQAKAYPDSKVHGANMGPIWDRKDPDWPHVGPMDLAIWVLFDEEVWRFL